MPNFAMEWRLWACLKFVSLQMLEMTQLKKKENSYNIDTSTK